MSGLLGFVDLGWGSLLPFAAALHAIALPASAGVAIARFRATVPPPVRWVPIAGAAAAVSALLLAAAVRLASPRAAATLVATFGPLLGGAVVLLALAVAVSLLQRHWAIGVTTGALLLALALETFALSFMTTPGAWPTSRALADALANPTLAPLLLARLGTTTALCGTCVLVCAIRGGDLQLPRAVTAGAVLGVAGAGLAAAGAWLWLRAVGPQPLAALWGEAWVATTAGRIALWAAPAWATASLLVAFVTRFRARFGRRGAVALLVVLAVAAVGSAEVARVGLSGPWIVGAPGQGWLLVNGLTRAESDAAVRSGLFTVRPELGAAGPKGSRERGQRIVAFACAPCHSARGMRARLEGWTRGAITAAVARLDRLSFASPPFSGDAADLRDVALALALLDDREEGGAVAPPDPLLVKEGKQLFGDACDHCHRERRLERKVAGWNEPLAERIVGRLHRMDPAMPELPLTGTERRALAAYLVTIGSSGRRER